MPPPPGAALAVAGAEELLAVVLLPFAVVVALAVVVAPLSVDRKHDQIAAASLLELLTLVSLSAAIVNYSWYGCTSGNCNSSKDSARRLGFGYQERILYYQGWVDAHRTLLDMSSHMMWGTMGDKRQGKRQEGDIKAS